MVWEHVVGFAAGFGISMVLFMLVLARRWDVDVVGAITRAWFTNAAIYFAVFGPIEFAALVHGYTGVYVGGVLAAAGLGYAIALLIQLAGCALVFATGFDIEVEAKRLARTKEKK